jgi:hypothetical protein
MAGAGAEGRPQGAVGVCAMRPQVSRESSREGETAAAEDFFSVNLESLAGPFDRHRRHR